MAPRKNYTPEQMEKAIKAVKNGEKVAVAAKQFGVPRVTLINKVTGKNPISCTMGPSTILKKTEEDVLVRWILALCEKRFPIPRDNLLDSVQKIMKETKRPNPFTNDRPGKKWFYSFMKRHPELVEKVPENLTKARDSVSEQGIRNWFLEIENYLKENGLQDTIKVARRIFNSDESAFFLSPKPERVLAKKGEPHLYSSCGDEKDNLTVLFTGNAAGEFAPPMIVFNYERVPSAIVNSVPDDWGIGRSDSGWMCGSTFYTYITNIFNPWLEASNIEKPVLFFVDGHRSHLTLHLSNFCSQNGIEVIALYPNSTHILQPMDVSVFRPLKVAWKKAVNEWKIDNLGKVLRKENFAPVLQKAVAKITPECIKNGFRAAGLYPFGPDYIDFSKTKQAHNTTATPNIDPAQKEFLKYLESEIVRNFSLEKFNLFNKLYFENRTNLEDSLPDEDTALYIIWAKNKSVHTSLETSEMLPSTSNYSLPAQAHTNTHADGLTKGISSLTPVTSNLSGPESNPTAVTDVISPSICEAGETAILDMYSSDNVIQEVSSLAPSTICNTLSGPAVVIEAISPLIDEVTAAVLQESKIHESMNNCCQSKNVNIIETTSTPTSESIGSKIEAKTPMKDNTVSQYLGCKVPTPFKKNLFWPHDDTKYKKRIKRERIPSAVTSKAFKDYYEKKEMEKVKQQVEKAERARQRQEKKTLKEKISKEKKSKLKTKKIIRKEYISDDTDMEIEYAESDDFLETDSEYQPSKYTFVKNTHQRDCIRKGSYVIVKYEGEYFPGKVENIQGNQFEVSTMVLSTGQTFKWPDKSDKIWYRDNEVIEKINEPICLNSRGFYKIREMEKYLPDIYI